MALSYCDAFGYTNSGTYFEIWRIIFFTYKEIDLKNISITILSEQLKFKILHFSNYIDLALNILTH